MKTEKIIACLSLATILTGCWTFNETPYPAIQMTSAKEHAPSIMVAGFEALLTEWEAVHGFQTVYIPGSLGHRHFEPSHFETIPSVTYIPQRRSSDMFLRRARDHFEQSGFTIALTEPTYTVDVAFEGPFVNSSDETKSFLWNICTIFFCDYGKTRWTAKLRIREAKTGRLLFHHDYDQIYETNVFGLIPLFGISGSDATNSARMQSWCLAALTDRACADATAFLAATK